MTGKDFGQLIHKLRKDRKLTQFSLGGLVGVTDKAVSKWEREGIIPQMDVLLRLAKVLNVDARIFLGDEDPNIPLEGPDLIRHREYLWRTAEKRLYDLYGPDVPLPVLSRFGKEMSSLAGSNALIIFDIVREISNAAEEKNTLFEGSPGLYGSLTAWLMGASPINPLPAYYRCPKCHKTEFHPEMRCGWDLPEKNCECGEKMERNGHNLPFEVIVCGNSSPYDSGEYYIGASILEEAQKIILRKAGPYFALRRYAKTTEEGDPSFTLIFLDAKDENQKTPDYIEDIKRVENVYNWGTSTSYAAFRFLPFREQKRTGRKAKPRIPTISDLVQEEVLVRTLKAFNQGNEQQKEFYGVDFTIRDPEVYRKGITFGKLVTLFCSMKNAWMEENAEAMAEAVGFDDLTKMPSSFDDIWQLIHRCAAGTANPADLDGIADMIVMRCARGGYINDMTETDLALFRRLNLPEWFPEYVKRIISLCYRSEITMEAFRMAKIQWQRMQVEK